MADWYEILSGVSGLGTGLMAGQAGAAAERRKREEAEATQGRLFEHQTGLQRLRGQQAMEELKAREVEQEKQAIRAEERTRAAKLKPFGALPPALQDYFLPRIPQQTEEALAEYSTGLRAERPQAPEPGPVDLDILGKYMPIITAREEEAAQTRGMERWEQRRGVGAKPAPGVTIRRPIPGVKGAYETEQGERLAAPARSDRAKAAARAESAADREGLEGDERDDFIRNYMSEYGAAQAGAAASAAAQARRGPNVPLSPSERILVPGAQTYGDIGGRVPSTPAARAALMATVTSEGLIEQLMAEARRVITAKSVTGAGGQRLYGGILSYTPGTAERLYSQTRDAFTGQLARSLGSERGVLTDRDIARVGAALPDFGDTLATMEIKETTLRNLIALERDARRAVIEGRDPEEVMRAFRPRVDGLLRALEQVPSASSKGGAPRTSKGGAPAPGYILERVE